MVFLCTQAFTSRKLITIKQLIYPQRVDELLRRWNSVASSVISTIGEQLASHPGYSIVTTGHSLGGSLPSMCSWVSALIDRCIGALSSLAGVTIKSNFPNVWALPSLLSSYQKRKLKVRQSQPCSPIHVWSAQVSSLLCRPNNASEFKCVLLLRTGNPTYASWVNQQFGPGEHFRGEEYSIDHSPTYYTNKLFLLRSNSHNWSVSFHYVSRWYPLTTLSRIPHVPPQREIFGYAHHGMYTPLKNECWKHI
jgi:hypothetical protein